jgi:hypothetical protein
MLRSGKRHRRDCRENGKVASPGRWTSRLRSSSACPALLIGERESLARRYRLREEAIQGVRLLPLRLMPMTTAGAISTL